MWRYAVVQIDQLTPHVEIVHRVWSRRTADEYARNIEIVWAETHPGTWMEDIIRVEVVARRSCLHRWRRCVHGDEINAVNGKRSQCRVCLRFLPELPVICSVSKQPHSV